MTWETAIWQLGVELMCLAPMFVVVGMIELKRRQLDRETRRNPVTTDLSNLPASSLNDSSEKLYQKQLDRLLLAVITPLMVGLLIAVRRIPNEAGLNWTWFDSILMLASMGAAFYYGRQISNDLPHRRRLKRAIQAELASAQEIATALAGNNRIIHDVQAGDFNIDHVVITPAGVFAIETKSRLKPPAGNGSPKVKYNGKTLEFPGWTESKPVEQAERQARWLANYLHKETGERFAVTAVLALPGWWIDRTARLAPDMVQVINPKNCGWLVLPERREIVLDSPAIQRAANAVSKLARAREDA